MVAIVVDSTFDIPAEVMQARRIDFVPLYIVWGTDTYKDRVELDSQTFYERLRTSSVHPSTSQPTPEDFLGLFRQVSAAQQTDEILCLTISQKMSGTYESAIHAAEQSGLKVRVLDSALCSMGAGFLALKAADLRDQNMSLDELATAVPQYIPNCNIYFTVATLDYLQRGGRIGKAKHLIGSALQIKPILRMEDGTAASIQSVRTRSKAIRRLAEILKEQLGDHPVKRVAVLDADASEEAEALRQEFAPLVAAGSLYLNSVSPVVGTHIGPGSVGLAYYAGD